jgi:DNA-binding transcriptional LysR family regulator
VLLHARASLGVTLTRDSFAVRSDHQPALWEMAKAGLGVGFAQQNLALQTPGIKVLPVDLKIPALPIWLTTHRELFTSHRIRAIYDALAEGLRTYISGKPSVR